MSNSETHEKCPECRGLGYTTSIKDVFTEWSCGMCNGTGKIIDNEFIAKHRD